MRNKSHILILSVVFLLVLTNFASNEVPKNKPLLISPRLQNSDINIVTPENKTYSQPMGGYYPATIGFEDQEEGTLPYGWNIMYGSNNNISIINEFDDHKKVLILNDTSPSGDSNKINNTFETQKYGSVEFWWAISNTNNFIQIALCNSVTGLTAISIDWKGWLNKWEYYDGGAFPDLPNINPPPKNNTFYHLRIDFERTTGGYQSLGQNKFRVIFNGDSSGELDLGQNTDINTFLIADWVTSFNCSNYFDAIGYSWDPNYNIGDNLNDGLLLSFENSTALDWIGYSLDGQANKTILGNTTIPLPNDGSHVIRVFGNDSLGTNYESEIRRFSVHHINIITPEDKIYTEPMSGYYPGTYGFENDEENNHPQDWIITGSYDAYIVSEKSNHKKVIKLEDFSSGSNQAADNIFTSEQDFGTIELWMYMDDVSESSAVFIKDPANTIESFNFRIESDQFWYNDGSWISISGPIPIDNTWHHIAFHFETTTGNYKGLGQWKWKIEIDEIEYGDYNFFNNIKPGLIRLYSGVTTVGNKYFDAISYSWDPNYNIGDNLNEGLLLSYENSTNLDWKAYSLDWSANRTILGNSTIPLPSDGSHVIRVFGNDSLGTNFESQHRYFTVNTTPYIDIVTPENKTYIELMSGYYPATYGFENEVDGSSGMDVKFVDNIITQHVDASVSIIPNFNGHNKVLKLTDANGVGWIEFDHYIGSVHSDAILEFWVAISSITTSRGAIIGVKEGSNYLFRLMIDDNDLEDVFTNTIKADFIQIDTFFQVKVVLNDTANTATCFVNGVNEGIFPYETNSSVGVDRIYMGTGHNDIVSVYFDAIGGSWDPDYNIGDNLNEGLLLSYDTNTDFNWTGYSLDGQANRTILGNTTIPMPEDGIHSIQVFGNDSVGTDYQSEIRHFIVDFTAPEILINSPSSNYLFGHGTPYFNITIIEQDLVKMWYTIDAGSTNNTITEPTGMINQSQWNYRPNGTVHIRFYATDAGGNIGYSEVVVRKDIINPIITIISPFSGGVFGIESPDFNISIEEDHLDSMWYTIDVGLTNNTIAEPTGMINQSQWNYHPNGTVHIRFYATDAGGNIGYSEVVVRKDIINPIITIISPFSGDVFRIESPDFNISIEEDHLDSIWYTLDNDLTNITISELTGPLNQQEWDKKGIGSIILKFYANDTLGNLGSQTVSIEKYYEYWNLSPFTIDDSGGGNYTWAESVNKGWCSGSGTWNDPYIIEYLKINGYNSYSCIEVRNSEVFFIIRNSIFQNSSDGSYDAGIKLDHVSNGTLISNNCSNNNGNGIVLETCQNIFIRENSVNYNGINGIILLNSFNNSILNNDNTITNNSNHGINLLWSNYNTITGNVINYNSIGIFLSESNYNIITGNDLRYNDQAYEEVNCVGNVFSDNILDNLPSKGLSIPLIISIIGIIIGIITVTIAGAITWKRKTRIREKVKEDKVQKKKIKLKYKLQKTIFDIEDLIKENNFDVAIKKLYEVKEKAQVYGLKKFIKEIEEKIKHCKTLELETINKIKQTVKDLGSKYPRLQLMDISEKSGIQDEPLIEMVLREMIKKKEIQGDYFSASKSLVLEVAAPVPDLEVKKDKNAFLSYSTKDTDHFEISRIVKKLELYPEIGNVYFWEADSGENIVTFMEHTLKKTNVFILFCSEKSIKSKAVEDEWQAAFQLRKKDLMKIVPVYEEEEHIPYLLMPLLNVKFTKDDFDGFIQKLYEEILR